MRTRRSPPSLWSNNAYFLVLDMASDVPPHVRGGVSKAVPLQFHAQGQHFEGSKVPKRRAAGSTSGASRCATVSNKTQQKTPATPVAWDVTFGRSLRSHPLFVHVCVCGNLRVVRYTSGRAIVLAWLLLQLSDKLRVFQIMDVKCYPAFPLLHAVTLSVL